MTIDPIDALSPLDGRYFYKVASLRTLFSEAGLMRARVRVTRVGGAGHEARRDEDERGPRCQDYSRATHW